VEESVRKVEEVVVKWKKAFERSKKSLQSEEGIRKVEESIRKVEEVVAKWKKVFERSKRS